MTKPDCLIVDDLDVALPLISVFAILILISACTTDRPRSEAPPPKRFGGNPEIVVLHSDGAPVLRGDSLQFWATTAIDRGSLIVRLGLRNVSRRSLHLEWGSCSLSPQFFTTDSVTGHPVFDWQSRPNPDPEIGRWACPAIRKMADLAAGDSLGPDVYVERIGVRRLAGDSLAPGRYQVGAQLTLLMAIAGGCGGANDDLLRHPPVRCSPDRLEQIVVPAGVIQLRR